LMYQHHELAREFEIIKMSDVRSTVGP